MQPYTTSSQIARQRAADRARSLAARRSAPVATANSQVPAAAQLPSASASATVPAFAPPTSPVQSFARTAEDAARVPASQKNMLAAPTSGTVVVDESRDGIRYLMTIMSGKRHLGSEQQWVYTVHLTKSVSEEETAKRKLPAEHRVLWTDQVQLVYETVQSESNIVAAAEEKLGEKRAAINQLFEV